MSVKAREEMVKALAAAVKEELHEDTYPDLIRSVEFKMNSGMIVEAVDGQLYHIHVKPF